MVQFYKQFSLEETEALKSNVTFWPQSHTAQRCPQPPSRARVENQLSCFQSRLCPSPHRPLLRLPHHPRASRLTPPGPSPPRLGPPPLLEESRGNFLVLLGKLWRHSIIRVGMNDLFFLSQHIVNPGRRLNMPLMMFIPADEAQLGRWDLCEPERKRPFGRWWAQSSLTLWASWAGGKDRAPGILLKWSPGCHLSFLPHTPSSHCSQGSNRGRLGALGEAHGLSSLGFLDYKSRRMNLPGPHLTHEHL